MRLTDKTIDMSDVFTPEGIKKLKKGQVLFFKKDGVETAYKITRKSDTKVFAKKAYMYEPGEVQVRERKDLQKANNKRKK